MSTLIVAQGNESFLTWSVIIALLAIAIGLVLLAVIAQFFGLWLQAFMSNAGVSLFDLIGMRLRKVDARVIVLSKIQSVKAGLTDVSTNALETHYLARGRVPNVVNAMIAANRAGIPLTWKHGCAIDLAGRDIL